MSTLAGQDARMHSINIRHISTDAEIVVLKFGKAKVEQDRQAGLRITGGDASDRNFAQVWIDCFARRSIPGKSRDLNENNGLK